MEIFQTICTALTNENELLTKFIVIPVTFIETYINMLLFTTLLKINASKGNKLKYFLFVSILGTTFNILIPNPYRSFINLALMLICTKVFFNTKIIKTILAVIIPILVTVLCESIMTKILSSIIDFNSLAFISVPIYRLSMGLCIQFLAFIIYMFIKYSKLQISIWDSISIKSKHIILLNLILAITSIIIQFLITGFYLEKLPIYIVIFSNISLIAYFLLSIYSLTKTTQLEITSLSLEQEKEANRILKASQDELHGFRHDFSNIMCTIGGYVLVSDMDGLKKYYSQIQKDITKINNLSALNPDRINNPAVFVLISSKYSKALELGIEMNINVFLNLNTLNMKIYEFTRTLGILLDNAIEAAKECDVKTINLEIRKDSARNRQILLIENTYKNKDIDTEKIYDKNFSTKKGNSGLGLWEVRKILKRNTNLNLYTTKNQEFFRQQLEMYNI